MLKLLRASSKIWMQGSNYNTFVMYKSVFKSSQVKQNVRS